MINYESMGAIFHASRRNLFLASRRVDIFYIKQNGRLFYDDYERLIMNQWKGFSMRLDATFFSRLDARGCFMMIMKA